VDDEDPNDEQIETDPDEEATIANTPNDNAHDTDTQELDNSNDINVISVKELMAVDTPDTELDTAHIMDQRYGHREHSHGLRPRRPRDFCHLHVILEETAMTQLSMNRGIKEFGDVGIAAVLNELQQLHDRGVLKPIDASSLTHEAENLHWHI
jgi:hypothetical protein